MIEFILNDQDIATSQSPGTTVLDFVRYHKNLKGTKIGCREGDCGACTVLIGELVGDQVKYRTMTSCLMPLANASGKHIVTVEGINPPDRGLTPVQQAMIDESGTQCGFCTVGFVMSLTGFCIDETAKTPEMAVSAVDGNICRCTGYKSIERAAVCLSEQLAVSGEQSGEATSSSRLDQAITGRTLPNYFSTVKTRLTQLVGRTNGSPLAAHGSLFVSGGTDLYVQKPDELSESEAAHLFYDNELRGIRDMGDKIEIGASVTVTDLLVSPVMQSTFPDLYRHLKLVSSTPIRNMATLAGNFVNASPIGDMTVWFLAMNASITLRSESGSERRIKLRDLYKGYKQLTKTDDEYITRIRFTKPLGDFRFNFEKVSKRTFLDIATVNTAIAMRIDTAPGPGWVPPALAGGSSAAAPPLDGPPVTYTITGANVAAGGVAPVPLYLKKTSEFLKGKEINEETITQANEIMQSEISPISDVRGSESYKRLLLRQLFTAHFVEMFQT